MSEDDWRTFPHGTITNVRCNRGKHNNLPTALYHVYWVDQHCPNAPQTKVYVYNHLEVSDELEAYSRFQKEMKEQNDGI